MKYRITLGLLCLGTVVFSQTLTEAVDTYGGELLYFESQPKTLKGAFGVTIGSQDNKATAVQWNDHVHIFALTEKYVGKYKDMLYTLDGDGTATELRGYSIGKDQLDMTLGMFGGSDYQARGFPMSNGDYSILVSTPMNDSTCTAFVLLDDKFQVRYSEDHVAGTRCRTAAVKYFVDGDYVARAFEQTEPSDVINLLTINTVTGEKRTRVIPGARGARQRAFFTNGLLLFSRYLPDERRTELLAYDRRLDSLWTASIGFGAFDGAWSYSHSPAVLLYKEPGRLFRIDRATGAAREHDLAKIVGPLPMAAGGYRIEPEAFVDLEDGRQLLAFRQIANGTRAPSNVFLAAFDADFKLKQIQEFKYTTHRPVHVYPTKETVFFTVGPQVFVFPKKQ